MALVGTDASHFRKYLTTLGIALIAGSLSLCGLFFQIQGDLLLDESKIRMLSPSARQTVLQRQRYLEAATAGLPYLLVLTIIFGVLLVAFGLIGWARRQAVTDAKEDLEGRKLEVEVRRMTDEERRSRNKEEALEVIEPVGDSSQSESDLRARVTVVDPGPSIDTNSGSEPTLRATIERISEAAERVADLAGLAFSDRVVEANVVIQRPNSRSYAADVVVEPHGIAAGYVFDLKFMGGSLKNSLVNRVQSATVQAATIAAALATNTKKYHPVVFFIFEDRDYRLVKAMLPNQVDILAGAFSQRLYVIAVGRRTLDTWGPTDLLNALHVGEQGSG